jgi:hypothetical protein
MDVKIEMIRGVRLGRQHPEYREDDLASGLALPGDKLVVRERLARRLIHENKARQLEPLAPRATAAAPESGALAGGTEAAVKPSAKPRERAKPAEA